MKTLTELFHIQAIATQESIDNLKIKNGTSVRTFNTWFFSYSGHVNRMDAKMYPIGWSTTADDSKGMEKQAYEMNSWGQNVYVKIPVINTKGNFSGKVIKRLSDKGIKLNITAVYTAEQVKKIIKCVNKNFM